MPAQPKSMPELDEGQRQAGLAVQARRHEMGRRSAVPGEGAPWTKLLADTDVPVERRVMLASAVKVFDQAGQPTDNTQWDYQRNLGELVLALVRQVDELREQFGGRPTGVRDRVAVRSRRPASSSGTPLAE